jgi:hypothetical protein
MSNHPKQAIYGNLPSRFRESFLVLGHPSRKGAGGHARFGRSAAFARSRTARIRRLEIDELSVRSLRTPQRGVPVQLEPAEAEPPVRVEAVSPSELEQARL